MLNRHPRSPHDPKAAAALVACLRAFEAEFEFVYRALRRYGMSAADAEDVAQDVFVVMLRRWSDFEGDRPLRPWLLGITNRVAMHHLRRAWRETPSGFVDARDDGPHSEDKVTARGARVLVSRALSELKEKQRHVFVLHELEGVTMQEIAQSTGEPLQTLYSRLKSAHRVFGRVVRRLGRFPGTSNAAFLPLSTLLSYERARPSAPPGLRGRVLERARSTPDLSETPQPTVAGAPLPRAGVGIVYATAVALTFAVASGVWTAVRLFAVDAPAVAPPEPVVLAPPPARRPAGTRGFGARTPALAPVPPPPKVAASAHSLSAALVGYWRFDEPGAGRGARDFSGTGTDCIAQGPEGEDLSDIGNAGPVVGSGWFGSAFRFSGDSWLECPDPRLSFDRDAELTISLWVKPSNTRNAYSSLVTRQIGDATSDHFFLGLSRQRITLTSDVFHGRILGPALPVNTWTHVVATVAKGVTTLYVDGIEVGHADAYVTAVPRPGKPLLVGGGINGPTGSAATQRFRGAIDELLLYDRALGRDEIAALTAGVQPRLSF